MGGDNGIQAVANAGEPVLEGVDLRVGVGDQHPPPPGPLQGTQDLIGMRFQGDVVGQFAFQAEDVETGKAGPVIHAVPLQLAAHPLHLVLQAAARAFRVIRLAADVFLRDQFTPEAIVEVQIQ